MFADAFTQYCTPPWCGADEQQEIRDFLQDEPEQLQAYEAQGYVPFFEIEQITFSRVADILVFYGGVEVDTNLEEHGVAIKLTKAGATFGYACDFNSELDIR